jgi:nicotinamidase-related amidase
MPLTEFDAHPALIVVDLRNGMSDMPAGASIKDVMTRSAELADAFRNGGLPVVLVSLSGGAPGRTDLGAAMKAAGQERTLPPNASEPADDLGVQPQDILIVKKRWGAFTGTTLHDDLQKANVTQVFIVGVATSIGVESTARSAHELGYNVVLVADAMSDVDPETHSNSIDRVFPRLGEVTSYAEVLEGLKDR